MTSKPRFCPKCGTAFSKNGNCINPDCEMFTPGEKEFAETSTGRTSFMQKMKELAGERNKQIVPDCINSDRDEVPIRQYDIARLQSWIIGAFAEGQLQITNKRILFRSIGFSLFGKNSLQYEFSLEEISGVEIRKEARFHFSTFLILLLITLAICCVFRPLISPIYSSSFLGFIFSVLMLAGAGITTLVFKKRKFISHLILSGCLTGSFLTTGSVQNAIGAIVALLFVFNMILLVFAPNLVIAIKTKGGTPSIEIRRKDGWFSVHKNEYTGFSQVMPGPDVDKAMSELGAIIREVQQTGTYSDK